MEASRASRRQDSRCQLAHRSGGRAVHADAYVIGWQRRTRCAVTIGAYPYRRLM